MVQWDPISPHTANGILLGYRVYLHEYNYWYYSLTNTVNTSSPSVHTVILRGLKAAHSYRISVAAFTSKGAGLQSYWRYITTGTISFLMNEQGHRPNTYGYLSPTIENKMQGSVPKKMKKKKRKETSAVKNEFLDLGSRLEVMLESRID